MGGVFSSNEQAIVIPLPGEDSKAVKAVVRTTNEILSKMRKIFCGKHTPAMNAPSRWHYLKMQCIWLRHQTTIQCHVLLSLKRIKCWLGET